MRTDFNYWQKLMRELKIAEDLTAFYELLIQSYSNPSRAYHNLTHLGECLRQFDECVAVQTIASAPLIEASLWFHDVVYDSTSAENEERSADLAVGVLSSGGLQNDELMEIKRFILITKGHQPGDNPSSRWITDIDLSILGQPPSRFNEYEAQIRAEYNWVSADLYREKRSEILQSFLARDSIFSTAHFRDRYETQARKNLEELNRRLTS